LELETILGNGKCKHCGRVYHLIEEHGICPDCGNKDFELLSGKEFFIKEIVAY
jgi:hydrogenase nickel incorporation protein HypA/HybF